MENDCPLKTKWLARENHTSHAVFNPPIKVTAFAAIFLGAWLGNNCLNYGIIQAITPF